MPSLQPLIDRVANAGGDAAERFLHPGGIDAQRFFAEVVEDLRRDPSYALETIALRAVEVHGAAARAWLKDGQSLPYSPDELARIAVRRSTNLARLEGGALGIGGFLTVAPDLAALVYILTREVVFVAAAYGLDPTHPDRAAELLVITEVYATVPQAQAALDRRGERIAVALAKQQVKKQLGVKGGSSRTLSEKMIRYAGKRAARRYGGRLVPGLGAVLGAIDNGASARETGERAIAFYRPQGTAKPRGRGFASRFR
ncbi:MAG: EcsC family protein [Patulibacter minatonensis]